MKILRDERKNIFTFPIGGNANIYANDNVIGKEDRNVIY